jgi:hypothetical protein
VSVETLTMRSGMMRNQPRAVGLSQDWITPRSLHGRLGHFDLDPCISDNQPWPTAARGITKAVNGLNQEWTGRVFLNPPYDRRVIGEWMSRMGAHGSGIALVFARTDTGWFQTVWKAAKAIYFFEGRIDFYTPQGIRATFNSGAPSCLIAYGEYDFLVLKQLESSPGEWPGKCVRLVP